MNYRPKYVAVGAYAPGRIARLWRPEEPAPVSPAVTAMENEGGPVPKDPASQPRKKTK